MLEKSSLKKRKSGFGDIMRKREKTLAFRRKRAFYGFDIIRLLVFDFDNCLMNAAGVACMTKRGGGSQRFCCRGPL